MIENNSLQKNFVYTLLLNLSNIIIPLILFPYIARVLSPTGLGKVEFVLSITQYFMIFAQLGIPLFAIREISANRNNLDKIRSIVQSFIKIQLVFSLIAVVFLSVLVLSFEDFSEYKILFLISSLNIMFVPFNFDYYFKAMEDFKLITIRIFAIRIINIILILLFVNSSSDIYIYLFIIIGTLITNNIVSLNIINKKINLFIKGKTFESKIFLKKLIPFIIFEFSIVLYINIDKTFIGLFLGDSSVGFYTLANRIVRLALTLIYSFTSILLPRLSKVDLNKKDKIILMNKSIDLIFFIAIPMSFGIFVLSDELVHLIGGSSYANSSITLKILTFLIPAIALSNLIGIQYFLSNNLDKYTLRGTVFAAVINFILNFILIPIMGINGAAFASIIAEWSLAIYLVIISIKILHLKYHIKNILKYVISSAIMIIILSYIRGEFTDTLFILSIKISLGIMIYVLSNYILKVKMISDFNNTIRLYLKKKTKGRL